MKHKGKSKFKSGQGKGMFSCLALFGASVLLASGAFGEDAAPAELEALGRENLPTVENRDIRDPFWPVGFYPDWWNRPEQEAEQEAARLDAWEEAGKLIKWQGGGRIGTAGFIAVINGRNVTKGDTISVEYDGGVYQWEIAELDESGMKLNRIVQK